jgi:hypothetical protein
MARLTPRPRPLSHSAVRAHWNDRGGSKSRKLASRAPLDSPPSSRVRRAPVRGVVGRARLLRMGIHNPRSECESGALPSHQRRRAASLHRWQHRGRQEQPLFLGRRCLGNDLSAQWRASPACHTGICNLLSGNDNWRSPLPTIGRFRSRGHGSVAHIVGAHSVGCHGHRCSCCCCGSSLCIARGKCVLTMSSSGPRGEAVVFPDVASARGRLTRR